MDPPTFPVPPLGIPVVTIVCPRCDRAYYGKDHDKILERVKRHVAEQHPDHDPNWAED